MFRFGYRPGILVVVLCVGGIFYLSLASGQDLSVVDLVVEDPNLVACRAALDECRNPNLDDGGYLDNLDTLQERIQAMQSSPVEPVLESKSEQLLGVIK
jgi:hypothetical protein